MIPNESAAPSPASTINPAKSRRAFLASQPAVDLRSGQRGKSN